MTYSAMYNRLTSSLTSGIRRRKFYRCCRVDTPIDQNKSVISHIWLSNVQIPLDGPGPNQTRPDQTQCPRLGSLTKSPTIKRHVWFWLNSITRARPDLVVDLPRKTRLEKPRRQKNCCRFFNYTIMQLRGCEFITEEEKTTLRMGEN